MTNADNPYADNNRTHTESANPSKFLIRLAGFMFLVSLFCVGVLLIRMALLATGGAVRADGFTAFIVSSPLFEWGLGVFWLSLIHI